MAEYWGYEAVLNRDGTPIAQVSETLDGPDMSTDKVETTHRDSNKKRTYMPGLQDDGEVSFSLIFDPSNAGHDHVAGLIKLREDGESDEFSIEWPDGSEWEFDAFVIEFNPSAPMEDAITATITLALTGEGITYNAPPPP